MQAKSKQKPISMLCHDHRIWNQAKWSSIIAFSHTILSGFSHNNKLIKICVIAKQNIDAWILKTFADSRNRKYTPMCNDQNVEQN